MAGKPYPEDVREAVLTDWAAGMSRAEIAGRQGLTSRQVETIVRRGRDNGDARAAKKRPSFERQERPFTEPDNASILASLAAENRPAGTPRRYLDIPNARLAASVQAGPRPRDVTALFFRDPPPGRSALSQRSTANANA